MNYALLMAALLGLTGIVFGAYGDHAVESQLSSADLESWSVAVRYHQMYAVVILALAAFHWLPNREWLTGLYWIATLFTVGTLLFSGSIYFIILTSNTQLSWLTPIGGAILIIGWVTTLFLAFFWQRERAKTY